MKVIRQSDADKKTGTSVILTVNGSSCLVLFYESFSASYSYTSLGYVENPGKLEEVLGTGSVHVDVFSSVLSE